MESSGIYKIVNQVDGKFYIGSAISFRKRWNAHRSGLKRNIIYANPHLQRAWNKYGEENFEFEVIEEVLDKSKLIEREQHYLDTLKPGYNICPIAGSRLGCKGYCSEETKKKISEAAKQNHPFRGKHHSEETKRLLSSKAKGRIRTEEHRKNLSLSLTRRFENKKNHPMHGRKMSEETKQKIRMSLLGKKRSDDSKRKMSLSHKGICCKENNGFFGKKHSEDSKRKMSESIRKRNLEKKQCC
jgi:group I intron endonuclease